MGEPVLLEVLRKCNCGASCSIGARARSDPQQPESCAETPLPLGSLIHNGLRGCWTWGRAGCGAVSLVWGISLGAGRGSFWGGQPWSHGGLSQAAAHWGSPGIRKFPVKATLLLQPHPFLRDWWALGSQEGVLAFAQGHRITTSFLCPFALGRRVSAVPHVGILASRGRDFVCLAQCVFVEVLNQ